MISMSDFIERILGGSLSDSMLKELRYEIWSGNGTEVIGSLVGQALGYENAEGSIELAMAAIENIGTIDREVACILMLHLWSPASDAMMHHICDAIDLEFANGLPLSAIIYINLFLLRGCADSESHSEWLRAAIEL